MLSRSKRLLFPLLTDHIIFSIKESPVVAKMNSDDSDNNPANQKLQVDETAENIGAFAVLEVGNKCVCVQTVT